ncbi:MAG: hypothetical protein A2139_03735 [Desulfobacca sp. RBG_16_60_12]|nr:MAG: hypothetical protein A2139_03735 [Desulfobacca sp. RBG_16_60_12]
MDAKAAIAEMDGLSERAATLAAFGLYDDLWKLSDDNQRAELKKERSKVLSDVFGMGAESPELRLELCNLLIGQKDVAGALVQLDAAAQLLITYDAKSLARYGRILAIKPRLVAAGVKAEGMTSLDSALATYKNGAFDFLKEQAENNQDYTQVGADQNKQIETELSQVAKLGFVNEAQAQEVRGFIQKWKAEKTKLDKEIEEQRKKDEAEMKAQAEKDKKADEAAKAGSGATPAPGTPGSTFGVPNSTGTGKAPATGTTAPPSGNSKASSPAGSGAASKPPVKKGG